VILRGFFGAYKSRHFANFKSATRPRVGNFWNCNKDTPEKATRNISWRSCAQRCRKLTTDTEHSLQRLAGGTNEIAQYSNVGTVGADAAGIHGQTKTLSEVEIDACIIELRQAETRSGLNPIHARRIDRPGRTMAMPRATRQLVELFPIAFVPSIHGAV
jgi:hypothetical protein